MVLVNEISCAMCEWAGVEIYGGWNKKGALIWRVFIKKGKRLSPRTLYKTSNISILSALAMLLFFVFHKMKLKGVRMNRRQRKSEMCSDEAKLK